MYASTSAHSRYQLQALVPLLTLPESNTVIPATSLPLGAQMQMPSRGLAPYYLRIMRHSAVLSGFSLRPGKHSTALTLHQHCSICLLLRLAKLRSLRFWFLRQVFLRFNRVEKKSLEFVSWLWYTFIKFILWHHKTVIDHKKVFYFK